MKQKMIKEKDGLNRPQTNWEMIQDSNLFFYCFIAVIVLFIGIMFYKNITLGEKSSDYKIICINGQEYYRANFMTKMGLTICLDVEGKPIPCQENK